MRDEIENLLISYMDVEANKSICKKVIAKKLKILPSDIDIYHETHYTGTVHQYIVLEFTCDVPKADLAELDYDYVNCGRYYIEVDEVFL
jgi:hypothetical protein